MPAVSEKQRRFMGAELGRKRAGKKTRTGMSEAQLEDFARKPRHSVRIAAARVSRRRSGSVGERSMAAKRSAGGYARA